MRFSSRQSLRAPLGLAIAALLASCGTPLVDTSYRGVPLLTLRGQVFGTSSLVDVNNPNVRVALFWVAEGLDGGPLDNASEQVDTGVIAQVPEAFVMNVFTMPHASQLISGSHETYGIAHVLAYVDTNGNGQKDADEPIVGIDDAHLIIAALRDLTAEDSPTGTIVKEGLHVVSIPLVCAPQTMGVVGGTTCGVPLGQSCMTNRDCGDGVCLQTFIAPWPSGGCALLSDPIESCTPTGAVVIHGPNGMSYWIEACETDADCKRGFPYVCDLSANACLPTGNMSVQVSDDIGFGALCEPPAPDGGMMMMVDGGRYPYPDGGCPLGPGVTQAGPDDAGMCPAPAPSSDGGILPFPDGGCPPGMDGQAMGPDDAGFCPAPPPQDGGMPSDGGMPPANDGGGVQPYPDGGCHPGPDGQPVGPDDAGFCPGPGDGGMPPPPDGGMPSLDAGVAPADAGTVPADAGPEDAGLCPPDRDGGIPPRNDAGECPPPPDGGVMMDAGLMMDAGAMGDAGAADQCPSPPELDGGLCPGPNMTTIPAPEDGVCPPPPRNDAGLCPGPPDAG